MPDSKTRWGASYRLIAAERWKAKSAAMGTPLTEALLEFAQPRPGMQVLDLATGTGEPAISLAQKVGPEGHISGVDLSADLLLIAEKRAQQPGLANISFHQGDAQALPFPGNSFDLATCRFGVMFFADVDKALGELRWVLRPGARACFVAWGPFDQPYWQSTMDVVVKHAGEPAIIPGDQDPFRFAQAGSLQRALRNAGFSETSEQTKAVGPVDPRSCGTTRDRSRCHFAQCWTVCPRKNGRRSKPKCTPLFVDMPGATEYISTRWW